MFAPTTFRAVPVTEVSAPPDGVLLDGLQHAAFGYFLRAVNPANGLVADTSREDSPASIAVVGFALASYPAAVERGWMTRADAVARSLAVLRFFHGSDQSGSPEATLSRVIHAYPTQAEAIKKAADACSRTRSRLTIRSLLRRWLA